MFYRGLGVLCASTLLAGCQGGSETADTTANIDPLDARTFATDTGDLGTALSSDLTVTARQAAVSLVRIDRNTNQATRIEDVTIAIRRNSDGFITFVVDGVEQPLRPTDILTSNTQVNRTYSDGSYMFAFIGSQPDFADITSSGNGFAERIGLQTRTDGSQNIDLRGRVVFGTEMADANVGALGSATYTGEGQIELLPTENYSSLNATQLDGRVVLTVNLNSTEISGVMDTIELQDPLGTFPQTLAGSLIMNPAAFDVNAFQGTLAPDTALAAEFPGIDVNGTATWSGAFYGSNGEEVGGVFSIDGTAGGDEVVGVGDFLAEKD